MRMSLAGTGLTLLVLLGAVATRAVEPREPAEQLASALAAVDAAQLELQNGRPEAFMALWSRADDVTLAGGFGGEVEKGWESVRRRLEWAGAQFTRGRHEITRLVVSSTAEMGYVVQRERIDFTPPGAEPTTREYRVTMIFRREPGGWRIVHRHADTQVSQTPPR